MKRLALALLLALSVVPAAAQEAPLTIVHYGPTGEVSSLEQAKEIRVIFSQPIVRLGRIPQPVKAPFFKVSPPISGSFRWSGTTTLIFTPDPKKPLPFATKYTVTIDPSVKSVTGNSLAAPLTFSFTTPTVRLLSTNWYRKEGKSGAPLVLALRFNQPINPEAVASHIRFHFLEREVPVPLISDKALAELSKRDPETAKKLEQKVAAVKKAATSAGNVLGSVATEWDQERFPPGKDLFVFETRPGIPDGTAIRVEVGPQIPSAVGPEVPGFAQEFTAELDPIFMVARTGCVAGCNPEIGNSIVFTAPVDVDDFRKAVALFDITDRANPKKIAPAAEVEERDEESWDYDPNSFTLEDAGFSIQPARTYLLVLDPSLKSSDGQTLGYRWGEVIDYWHKSAFSSFGEGHGVWEPSGGTVIPFSARNLQNVSEWRRRIGTNEIMPMLRQMKERYYRWTPEGAGTERDLDVVPDRIQYFGFDAKNVLTNGKGIFWGALLNGDPIEKAEYDSDGNAVETMVQVTNLGLTVKDSPQNTLIMVTRLDNGAPVEGAKVEIRTIENKVFWQGTTDARGLALAPRTNVRKNSWDLWFAVIAEKDGDVAYVASDWYEGVHPWTFDINYDLDEANPHLRGTIFADRGVYKLGEEVHIKAILRSDTPDGIRLLPGGTAVEVTVNDSEDNEIDKRTVKLNDWSAADWTFKVPTGSPLGTYTMFAKVKGQQTSVYGNFLVAAYRRPDFRVDATLTAADPTAGATLKGVITGKYLFGAPMNGRPIHWTFKRTPTWVVPRPITDRFPEDRFEFVGYDWTADEEGEGNIRETATLKEADGALDKNGNIVLDLPTDPAAGWPLTYSIEGEVTDVSRQTIAGRTALIVHPAPWYIGVRRLPYFLDTKDPLRTEIVAVKPNGETASGVEVKVSLTQIQWNSVRRNEGNGFYTWETERKEIATAEKTVVTGDQPVPLELPLGKGGYFVLRATAVDGQGRTSNTVTSFYALGEGYSAWERYDHNRIDLVPEKKTWRPGETARIMIKSPWEKATALLTTEREGIRSHRQFTLNSTQETVTVPITEADIPNVYVSVVLVKGRTKEPIGKDGSDPGKPAFRLGYAALNVVDDSKRLAVDLNASQEEYRPGAKATVSVAVRDHEGKPAPSEVTLWAVDYGVLSLTAYRTPDILGSVYVHKALQVLTEDSRQKIISRRVMTPKGAGEGGGGGMDMGANATRKDFRVLAFWLGSVVTDANGKATKEVKLPESLTTYRIMAVAGDKQSRFGSADREIRTNKPVLLKQAFPRFMTLGDKAYFGAAVHSQLKSAGTAIVTIRSLDPEIAAVVGNASHTVEVKPNTPIETRFDVEAKRIGNARMQMSVKMGDEEDSFEDVVPVRYVATPETVAAYGIANPRAEESLEIPAGVIPAYGGLRIELASTALVGLSEGARYLVDYPYGCAEQRSSAAWALMLAHNLGEAFKIPGIDGDNLQDAAQQAFTDMAKYQCANGGFGFWQGDCRSVNPYLTSYVLQILARAKKLGYVVSDDMLGRGYTYLEEQMATPPPTDQGWWPSYNAWQAFAVKVLVEGGRNQDSNLNRLMERLDRMPVFAIAYLHDALVAKGETASDRAEELRRRMRNAILPEAGASMVGELNDPYLLWFWNSNIRSTAIVLNSLVRSKENAVLVTSLVRGLLRARKNGRWGNTQENAWALGALVDYYQAYESQTPQFTADVTLGGQEATKQSFEGRSTTARATSIPMTSILQRGPAGTTLPLVFEREGTGVLHYVTRFSYVSTARVLEAMNQGFVVERTYSREGDPKNKPITSFKAGELVKVTLRFRLPKERRFVAVTDPLPAGFEPVESWFATTASQLAAANDEDLGYRDWTSWWREGGFDRVERHDDRVNLFATRLDGGEHVYSYLVRATTSGNFHVAPTRVEEMYTPEIFGRTPTANVDVKK
jgi:uncharacterized protein YfaS (alpha-2-macroglobulin family)